MTALCSKFWRPTTPHPCQCKFMKATIFPAITTKAKLKAVLNAKGLPQTTGGHGMTCKSIQSMSVRRDIVNNRA